jgi:hypothetical protein
MLSKRLLRANKIFTYLWRWSIYSLHSSFFCCKMSLFSFCLRKLEKKGKESPWNWFSTGSKIYKKEVFKNTYNLLLECALEKIFDVLPFARYSTLLSAKFHILIYVTHNSIQAHSKCLPSTSSPFASLSSLSHIVVFVVFYYYFISLFCCRFNIYICEI